MTGSGGGRSLARMKRTLRLKKDVLTELTTDELGAVVGGADTVKTYCELLSIDATCGRPTCGRNCTAVSDPVTKH